jgi:hypothetical protein
MRTVLNAKAVLIIALVLAGELAGVGLSAAAASSETNLAITIHVKNYACVNPKTLAEAEEVATGIFQKAGVETRWTDVVLTTEMGQENSADHSAHTLADIQLSILPRAMSDRDGAPNNAMGLAPGNGADRTIVYIFERNVEARFWRLLGAQGSARLDRRVSKAQILGHAIAHEVGHLLLNQQVHSEHGIMRGEWGVADFREITYGKFLFTPQQAEFLRADVRRRSQQETLKIGELESTAPVR